MKGATTISLNGLYATLNIAALYHYAECRILFIVILNIILVSVHMLSV